MRESEHFSVFLTFLCLLWLQQIAADSVVNMKVVDEPTNYGANLLGYQQQAVGHQQTLKARVAASNFSGPPHLIRLYGRCFTKVVGDYKYELCPFANVTQHEHVLRWNAYSGVLGVWQEWNIVNNTFVSMLMANGDSCGQRYRSAEVVLVCGNQTAIVDVSEPQMCDYVINLKTPLVCHPDSMLVYPTLTEKLRHRWDIIEGQRTQGFLTAKGYKNRLQRLFIDAGYKIDPERHRTKTEEAAVETAEKRPANADEFLSLFECRTEYTKLQRRIEDLEETLKRLNITSTTNAAN